MAWDLTEYEKGYIAAFLDGEGTIALTKTKQNKSYYYRPMVAFYNTHEETINWISNKLGQKMTKRTIDKRRDSLHTKDNYCVAIRKQSDILSFLEMIYPYLKIKRKQCELIIDFIEYRMNRELYQYSKEDLEYFDLKHKECHMLNRGD